MKNKITLKNNSRGIAHVLVLLLIVVGIAVAGTALLVAGHADPAVRKHSSYQLKYRHLNSSEQKKIKEIASDYWNGICAKNGKDIKFIYYSWGDYLNRFPDAKDLLGSGSYSQLQDSLKYFSNNRKYEFFGHVANIGDGFNRHAKTYCRVYLNDDTWRSEWNNFGPGTNSTSRANLHSVLEFYLNEICDTVVHEVGHLDGKYHNSKPYSIMNSEHKLLSISQSGGGGSVVPRCNSEFYSPPLKPIGKMPQFP